MGSTYALGLMDAVEEGELSLRNAIAIHLRSNHYPPVPESMIEPCLEAIQIVQGAQWGDNSLDDEVTLPEGVLYRGQLSAPARAIVHAHHLESFIEWEEQ